MFENILYPKEIVYVMTQVLAGTWTGDNPEAVIDQMLGDFYYNKITDKNKWAHDVAMAIKQLGCLDCVFARLNLECLLEQHTGDTIVIRGNRHALLPGENHGICNCRLCINDKILKQLEDSNKIPVRVDELVKVAEDVLISDDDDDPYVTSAKHDNIAHSIYATEKTIKHEIPRPSLSDDRKVEILKALEQTGFQLAGNREDAYKRLEEMLRKRSPEQNIIGRLAYLIIFDALRSIDSHKFLNTIKPTRYLINK